MIVTLVFVSFEVYPDETRILLQAETAIPILFEMQNPRTDLPIVIKQAISLDTALIEATCKEVFEDDAQFLHMYGRARSRSEISSILRAWSFMQERLYIDVLSVGNIQWSLIKANL